MKKLEIVLSVQNLLDLGGTIEPGTKIITHPNISWGIESKDSRSGGVIDNNPNESKEYTFVEIVEGEGIKVEEIDSFLGTGWLFTTAEVSLSSEMFDFSNVAQL